jgi:hypothetical protein
VKKIITLFGDVSNALQLLGVLLFVVVGPFIWMYWLAASHHFIPLSVVTVFWILSLAVVIREVRHKAVTPVSLGVFLVWLVVLGFVFSEHFL